MTRYFLPILIILLFNIKSVYAFENQKPSIDQNTVMTQGLNHLGLTVKNLQASSNFFINTLGWKKAGGYPDYPSIFVTDGNIFLTLWQTKDDKKTVAFDRKHNVGLHHLALTVISEDVLFELHRRFKLLPNVIVEFAPEPNGKGPTIHMMVREPSGNRIEFSYTPKKA